MRISKHQQARLNPIMCGEPCRYSERKNKMAIVRPFNGMRFTEKAGDIKELCCPPYDIVSEEERKALVKKNPHNVIRLELPGEKGDKYKKAKELLDKWLEDGTLAIDENPCFYVYEERFTVGDKERSFKGIIAKVHLYGFERGIILPHEQTLSKAKEDRFNLMQETACNFSQVYSLYDDEAGKIDKSIERISSRKPDQSFTDDAGVTHSLWVVPRCTEIDKISANMAGKKLYIADGHHRYETALKYRNTLREQGVISEFGDFEQDYIMMMLVNMHSNGLVVFPTHRIVHGIEGFSANSVVRACSDIFDTGTTKSAETASQKLKGIYDKGETGFCMYDGKKYILMKLKEDADVKELMKDSSDALRKLDVSVLQKLVFERVMGIDAESVANGTNISYTRDIGEAVAAVDNGEANCCFLLNPTRVEEIAEVARAGEKMPQKSTYFYPKLITGLVMNKLDRVKEDKNDDNNGEQVKKADYVGPEAEICDM